MIAWQWAMFFTFGLKSVAGFVLCTFRSSKKTCLLAGCCFE